MECVHCLNQGHGRLLKHPSELGLRDLQCFKCWNPMFKQLLSSHPHWSGRRVTVQPPSEKWIFLCLSACCFVECLWSRIAWSGVFQYAEMFPHCIHCHIPLVPGSTWCELQLKHSFLGQSLQCTVVGFFALVVQNTVSALQLSSEGRAELS